ncbi:PDK repeat-containing protein [Frankia sp. EI5c]|uniref:PKD domain-containing protein n=1 Tax=Frankia sp. EI5c TaxID=683316 RepID=UPI0007C24F66|nr:PKD domain-containing protein [Frankia sp. EI5c]OAA25216.1 PDK repeat-containing protein [Frankia sp. EI5c]
MTGGASRSRRFPARWAEIAAAVLLVLGGLVVAGTATGPGQQTVSFTDGKAWLVSDAVGQVALVDGSSEKVVTQVTVGRPGLAPGTLTATQADLDAYVTDSSTGTVGRISGATYAWNSRDGVTGPGSPDQIFAGAGAVYLVNGRSGIVTILDPETMRVRGSQSLAARIGSDGGVVDSRGWLWVIDALTGDLVWFDGTTRHDRRAAVDPEHTRLVLVDGRPTLVDLSGRRVAPISADGALGTSTCLDLASGDATARVAGDPHEPRVFAAVGSRGVLMIIDLEGRQCQSVVDLGAASHDLGPPLAAAGRVFVPDHTSGQVHIVDLAAAELLAAPRVLPEHRPFTLASQGGFVFFNDPASEQAGLIRPDGSTALVRKYIAEGAVDAAGPAGPDSAPGGTGEGTGGGGEGDGAGTGTGTGNGETPPPTVPSEPPSEPPSTPPSRSPSRPPGPPPSRAPADRTPPTGPLTGPQTTRTPPRDEPTNTPPATGGPSRDDPATALRIAASDPTPSVGEAVTYQVTTTAPGAPGVVDVAWNFGDGSNATGTRAPHTWAAAGTFTVTANVFLADGQSATLSATVTVSRNDPPPTDDPGTLPVPRLVVTPTGGPAPLTVTADASSSTAANGPVARYLIDFGDGTTAGQARATHTYTRSGTFRVSVTVTDGAGRTAVDSRNVQVDTVTATGPTARLGVSAAGSAAPTEVVADASGSTAGSTAIADYTFRFSTGAVVGPQASPTARLAVTAGGTYSVTVTVRDAGGRESTANGNVTVSAAAVGPRAAVSVVTPPAGGQGGTYSRALDASASTPGSSPIVSYTFDFGDGTVMGPQSDPVSAYTMYGEGGDFVGTVTVIDQNGLRSTASVDMLIRDRDAEMTLSKTVISASPGGTEYQVTIMGGQDPIVISSISGPVDGSCVGTRLLPYGTCTLSATVGGGTTSTVVTVRSDATNSPVSIDLAS